MNRDPILERINRLDRRTHQETSALTGWVVCLVILCLVLALWCVSLQDRIDRVEHRLDTTTVPTQP